MPAMPRLRSALPLLVAATAMATLSGACRLDRRHGGSDTAERDAIADSLTRIVREAYDFSKPDVVDRLLALYPDTGQVVSAAGGRVITSRDTLDAGIRAFWMRVGRNMRNARTEWGPIQVDVPSTRAAVVTAQYRVPHTTPTGAPHAIGGAMTLVFARQGTRWVVIQEHLSDLPQGVLNTVPDSAGR